MSDLISRADVIDMLEMYPFTEYSEYEAAREVVKRLPSAQPTQTNADLTHTNALDCVSRQQAIDAVNEYLRLSEVSKTVQNMTSIQTILRWLPSAQPQWIPCSERNPDRDGKYLVTSARHKLVRVKTFTLKYWWEEGMPLAWMPLPEPYGGESDE